MGVTPILTAPCPEQATEGARMRYALALDLVDDAQRIAEYEKAHERIWPEERDHLRAQGVLVMEVDPAVYSVQAMAEASLANPVIQRWETLMWTSQAPTPWTPAGEKWVFMDRIFSLASQ